jgi:predicted transglutaminase-like cysteine proteinase
MTRFKEPVISSARCLGIPKALFALSILLAISCQTRDALAASDSWKKVNGGFNRRINFAVGQARWRVNSSVTTRPVSLGRKIADFISNHEIESLEDYAEWLRKNVKYKPDMFADSWSSPEDTLTRRRGDCEDFAFLSEEILSRLGYDPQIIAFKRRGIDDWHAICVFKKGGCYLYFDNSNLIGTPAESLEQLAGYLNAESDFVMLNVNNIIDLSRGTINLGGVTKGARLEKLDGRVRIVSDGAGL